MLSFLGEFYGKLMDARNRLYDKGVFDVFDLGARTISVGNITTGGTGKTPLVAYIANLLADNNEKVCILTRGYGRKEPSKRALVTDGETILADAETAGDEPMELAQKLLGKAIVLADADRVAAAEWAKRRFGVSAFILDDGFQHRRAKRDVDIVCVDATNPFGGGEMLPAGRLREPLTDLKRATAIVITRSDLVSDEVISDLRSQISDLAPRSQLFTAVNNNEFVDKNGAAIDIDGRSAFAFCGIGNPQAFVDQLGRHRVRIVGTRAFKDHHHYTAADISSIESDARNAGAEFLLTTAKDAVKLAGLRFETPYFVAGIEVQINNAAAFAELLIANG